jgi:IS30 family transposase
MATKKSNYVLVKKYEQSILAMHQLVKRQNKYSKFVFFADSYLSWQLGSNENFNGILREFSQKRTDLTVLSLIHIVFLSYDLIYYYYHDSFEQ